MVVDSKDIDYLVKKYHPFLKRADFRYLIKENDKINKEAWKATKGKTPTEKQTRSSVQPDKAANRRKCMQAIDSYLAQGKKDTAIGKMLPDIRRKLENGKELTAEEGVVGGYVQIIEDKSLNLSPAEKRQQYDLLISNHQRLQMEQTFQLEGRSPVRTQMIEETNKELGLNRKIVQNDTPLPPDRAGMGGLKQALAAHAESRLTNEPTNNRLNMSMRGSGGSSLA